MSKKPEIRFDVEDGDVWDKPGTWRVSCKCALKKVVWVDKYLSELSRDGVNLIREAYKHGAKEVNWAIYGWVEDKVIEARRELQMLELDLDPMHEHKHRERLQRLSDVLRGIIVDIEHVNMECSKSEPVEEKSY